MSPDDIRDIRAPWLIGAWWHWPLAIGAGALVALGFVLAVRYMRKRRAKPLTPHQQALANLRSAEALAREGSSREWADLLADTLRLSMSTRLGREVGALNTSELAQAWSVPPLVFAPALLELLRTCDLARFARASLDEEALLAQTAIARELVGRLFEPSVTPSQTLTVAP